MLKMHRMLKTQSNHYVRCNAAVVTLLRKAPKESKVEINYKRWIFDIKHDVVVD